MINKRTLCIIGYGRNGVAIAKRAKYGFNMNIIGIVRELRDNIEGKEFTDELYGFDKLNKDIISKADFILTTLPETKESRGLFNKKFFESMKKDAVFINIGRGSAVIEEDLIEALNNNIISNMNLWIKMINFILCQKRNYLLLIIVEILPPIILIRLMNY